jgi:hypothetical protein
MVWKYIYPEPDALKALNFRVKFVQNSCQCMTSLYITATTEKFKCPPPPPRATTCHIDFVVPPPGCGRSITDFWGWGAHRAQFHCPDDVSDICERGVPGRALNPSSTSYSDHHGRCGNLPLQGKIPTAEPEIEPGTSWLVVRSSDHKTTRLVGKLQCWNVRYRFTTCEISGILDLTIHN